ncbi:metallophosphoesterase [Paenibacillus vulneris]|uniref:Metallophosphoesterase n=1 Tax=Paenibacillus vulneris TaxID=1133364 RepID=A0ABW3UGT9_9BACL
MSADWFIADPHFGHKNILKYENRPFVDIEHMDNIIIENYNRTISEGDTVYWLGDMFFCKSDRMEYIAKRLSKGRNILIRGNHDKGVTDGKFLKLGFKPYRMMSYYNAILTHEPISEVNMSYLETEGIRFNIHGHVHSRIDALDQSKYQCVSVENTDYSPISIDEIINRFRVNRKKLSRKE